MSLKRALLLELFQSSQLRLVMVALVIIQNIDLVTTADSKERQTFWLIHVHLPSLRMFVQDLRLEQQLDLLAVVVVRLTDP